MISKIPNFLTLVRIISIPIIISTFYFDDIVFAHRLGAGLFVFAAITDYLDGFLARKFNLHSRLGIMLDPIADKLLVGSILIMMVKYKNINEIPCILILCREFAVAGLREFLGQLSVSVPVSKLAKVKTFLQMLSMSVIMLGSKGSGISSMDIIGNFLLWVSSILTIVTAYSYFKAGLKHT